VTGGVASATIPSDVAPGQYLLRHEIIALHLADQMGGAEFYSSCTQLNIGGSGTGVPSANELVSFPGAYSDDDPGIYTPDVRTVSFPSSDAVLSSFPQIIYRFSTLAFSTTSLGLPLPN
jgi:hypothetical protein